MLVVAPEEYKEHRERGRNVLVSPAQGRGMAAIRGWILKRAIREFKKGGDRYIAILDDDLYFQKRRPNGSITKMSVKETEQAFDWLENALVAYPMAALGTRFLSYAKPGREMYNSRMMQTLAYDLQEVIDAGARFDKGVPEWFPMDDFHMTLQMLQAGKKGVVSLIHRASPGPSQAPGGCSEQRTKAKQNESAKILAKLYPDLVTLRKKQAKWYGETSEFLDVRVKWRRAYVHHQG